MQNKETYIFRQLGSGFRNMVFSYLKQKRTMKSLLPQVSATFTIDFSWTGISTKRPEQPCASLVNEIFSISFIPWQKFKTM